VFFLHPFSCPRLLLLQAHFSRKQKHGSCFLKPRFSYFSSRSIVQPDVESALRAASSSPSPRVSFLIPIRHLSCCFFALLGPPAAPRSACPLASAFSRLLLLLSITASPLFLHSRARTSGLDS
jgi:hypothetical protein